MKNLTLAKRIAIGFGVVLGLTILLGALAVFEMRSGSHNAHKLSDQYVPEVSICGDLQAATLNTMLAVRSFGYTSDGKFHEQAQAGMTEIQQTIQTAKDLVTKYPNLVKLKEGVGDFEKGYAEFASLAADTKKQSDAVNRTQAALNASAAKFVAQMESFQNEQEQLMRADIKAGVPADKLEERALKLEVSAELRTLMNQIRIAVWKAQAERDLNVAQAALPKFADLEKGFGQLTPVTHLEQHKQKLLEMQAAAKTYQEEVTNLVSEWAVLNTVGTQRAKVSTALAQAADEIAAVGVQRTTEVANDSAKKMDAAAFISLLGVGIAIVLGIILAWLITRGITRVVVGIAQSLALGADQTAVAAAQVSAASQTLAEGASESAASLEETSASLEEMASMTQRNAGNAQQANGLAKAARTAAEQGNQDMAEMTQAMAAIKASSDDIAKILKTIDEIAFQTNLLALNAAVEAARAGEAGAGFAVVADEVRSLAQRAASAAKETATKIDGAITRSEQGVEISNKVAVTLTEIVAKVRQVDELVAAVSGASTEQSQGITQINIAVTQMDKVTQSNAASAEESAAAAEELNAQADAMKVAVGELQRLVSGTTNGGTVVSAPKAGKHSAVGNIKPEAVKPAINCDDRLEGNSSVALPKPSHEAKVSTAANVPAEFMNF